MNPKIISALDSPNKKLITIRHFHSTLQGIDAQVQEMKSVDCNFKMELIEKAWHDLYSTLSTKWVHDFQQKTPLYKQLIWKICSQPVIIQTSPYVRCVQTLALLLSEHNKSISHDLCNTRKELYEFEIDGVPVIVRINDMLMERDLRSMSTQAIKSESDQSELGLTLSQKQKLWYYQKLYWWESMVDVMLRCKAMLQEFYEWSENQFRVSHKLFLGQLINTVNKWSYYWYAEQDNRNLRNWSINIFEIQAKKLMPQITGELI